jgi:branched-chain amino acid transport system ATP-binding protein
MKPLLTVRGLRAGYGDRTVLKGLDLEVAEGSAVALLGANGAGKTTTLRALSGLTTRRGEIVFNGVPITRRSTEEIVRLKIAHVPERGGTIALLSVEDNLKLGAISRAAGRAVRDDLQRVYTFFPVLKERRRQQAGLLSGGERQMLAVGRALMLRPRMMLLDEPSFGLAPIVTAELFDLLRRLRREEHVSLLIAEQNAELASDLCDHACLLEAGAVVRSGPSADMRADGGVRRSYPGQ